MIHKSGIDKEICLDGMPGDVRDAARDARDEFIPRKKTKKTVNLLDKPGKMHRLENMHNKKNIYSLGKPIADPNTLYLRNHTCLSANMK